MVSYHKVEIFELKRHLFECLRTPKSLGIRRGRNQVRILPSESMITPGLLIHLRALGVGNLTLSFFSPWPSGSRNAFACLVKVGTSQVAFTMHGTISKEKNYSHFTYLPAFRVAARIVMNAFTKSFSRTSPDISPL
jgi:hypothetical protein